MTLFPTPQDPEPVKKAREITLYKNRLYKSIESITQKHIDASAVPDVKIKDALAADAAEDLDGLVLADKLEFRDAELRKALQTVLEEETVAAVDNVIEMDSDAFHYSLLLDESFKDATLRSLALYMHRYLVYGALFDWYSEMGQLQQASVYGSQLQQAENEIIGALKGPSIVKRPLQPFGPAKKMPI